MLISLDVSSLFINILTNLAIESITKKWINIKHNISIPFDKFISIIEFVSSTIFQQQYLTNVWHSNLPLWIYRYLLLLQNLVLQELEN